MRMIRGGNNACRARCNHDARCASGCGSWPSHASPRSASRWRGRRYAHGNITTQTNELRQAAPTRALCVLPMRKGTRRSGRSQSADSHLASGRATYQTKGEVINMHRTSGSPRDEAGKGKGNGKHDIEAGEPLSLSAVMRAVSSSKTATRYHRRTRRIYRAVSTTAHR